MTSVSINVCIQISICLMVQATTINVSKPNPASKAVLKMEGLTERRSAVLGLIVKEYDIFDKYCDDKDQDINKLQNYIKETQAHYESMAKLRDEQIEN